MRAIEFLRNLLDIIDKLDHNEEQKNSCSCDTYDPSYANSPDEITQDIKSVTIHAGGGPNTPKHPHDLRVKDPSMYPNQQDC